MSGRQPDRLSGSEHAGRARSDDHVQQPRGQVRRSAHPLCGRRKRQLTRDADIGGVRDRHSAACLAELRQGKQNEFYARGTYDTIALASIQLTQQYRAAVAELKQALADLEAVNTGLNRFAHAFSGILYDPIGPAREAESKAQGAVDQVKAALDRVNGQYVEARTALDTAKTELAKCEQSGGSGAQALARSLSAVQPAAGCGTQASALGRAQGQAKAYGELGSAFARVHLDIAAKRMRGAAATLRHAAAGVSSKTQGAKVAGEVRSLALAFGRAASRLEKLATTTHGFAAKRAAAQKRSAAAQSALTACQTASTSTLKLQVSHTYPAGNPGYLYLCGNITGPTATTGQVDITGPAYHATGSFTISPTGRAGFIVKITATGTYKITATAGSNSATASYLVPAAPQQGPLNCAP